MAVRPIDANALLDHIKDLNTWYNDDGYIYGYDMKYPDGMFFPDDIIASIENTPTLTQPNEWVKVMEAINNAAVAYIEGGPYENDLPGMEFALKIDRLSRDFVHPPEGEEDKPTEPPNV